MTGFLVVDNTSDTAEFEVFILEQGYEHVQVSDTEWTLFQRYQIGKDDICIRDCFFTCSGLNRSVYASYVQTWGKCMCKCAL